MSRLARRLALALVAASLTACSSGISSTPANCNDTGVPSTSGNLSTGLFFGFEPKNPITSHDAAGGLIPGVSAQDDKSVVFYAFVTRTPADDAAKSGDKKALDRDGALDTNDAPDVFVAAVVDRLVDEAAFSYSLAGKFRHPRCVNCHSMAEDPDTTTLFDAPTPHPGAPPGDPIVQNVPESESNVCMGCHAGALDTIAGTFNPINRAWRNPKLSLDANFRALSNSALADRARNAIPDHFAKDRRIDWALTSGLFSFPDDQGGFSIVGSADDDQDGVIEPFDTDGRRRLVPGGRARFLAEIDAFLCGGPDDTRAALVDVVLASRRATGNRSGNGESLRPAITYVPRDAYEPGTAGRAGTVYVAFESAATNLRDGMTTTANVRQVYRSELSVRVLADGSIDLRHETTELVSQAGAAPDGGNLDSGAPAIGGDGARVAFSSLATNLGTNTNGVRHVHVRDLELGAITQVTPSGATADSDAPAIERSGLHVAFESAAVFPVLPADANGQIDVYFAELVEPFPGGVMGLRRASRPNAAGDSDTTGPSTSADIVVAPNGEIFVAFTSANDLDTSTLGPPPTGPNVYVHRALGNLRATRLVTAAVDFFGNVLLGDGASVRGRFVDRFDRVAIETEAANLDSRYALPPDPPFASTFKGGDENGAPDALLLDLSAFLAGNGQIRAEGLTVNPTGAFADAGSTTLVAGRFVGPASARPSRFTNGFAGVLTSARNVGAADNHLGGGAPTPWLTMVAGQIIDPGPFAPVWAVLGPNCLGCHSDAAPNGGFSLGAGSSSAAHQSLVTGTGNDVCITGSPYVVPGDPDASVVVQVIQGPLACVPQMPVGPPLSVDQIAVVRDWITNGALE